MKFKTFLSTFMLFAAIFFAGMGVVSVYMSNSQFNMLKEKSEAEYKTITATFTKDLAVLKGRIQDAPDFIASIFGLINDYKRYYLRNGISLELEDLGNAPALNDEPSVAKLSFESGENGGFIYISGRLSGAFSNYRLNYSSDISETVLELQDIQRVLILLAAAFSAVAAVALYLMLSGIFKPLAIVSKTSRKLAEGHYKERIRVKGRNEVSSMAEDFNRMAAKIENQIRILEDEAEHKQQFVDSLAHEIRTPLTSIHGFAQYLRTAKLDEDEIIDSADSIIEETGYMRKISDSLLELATLRNTSIEPYEISIPQLIDSVVTSLKKTAYDKGVKIISECNVEFIRGQADLLRSLLLNLCFNAIKACSARSGVIRLVAKADGGNTVLTVTDNGCGIPKENLPYISEPFYRVDKGRSRESGGAGLGLALCKQIAEVHGARMRIRSKTGKGTQVEVIFNNSLTILE